MSLTCTRFVGIPADPRRQKNHNDMVEETDHKANSHGLKNLMQHKPCEIMAFTKDVWEELLDIVTLSKKCENNLLNGYSDIYVLNGNDRSGKIEDVRIQEDLDHIRTNKSEL